MRWPYALGIILCCGFVLWGCKLAPAATPQASSISLSWESGNPLRSKWSKKLTQMIGEHLPTFAGASDVATFCPSFASLGEQQKTRVIAEMFVKIAKFESSWNPQTTFQEPPPPKGPGTISRGLFQMSYGDGSGCPNTKAKGDLHDPIVNIDCAVKKAVVLVKKYGLIQNSANHGMARYWSVIRNGHHVDEIRKHTKGFCK